MRAFTVLVAAFAAMAAAKPIESAQNAEADLYLSGNQHAKAKPAPTGNKCSDCAKYCADPSNGAAIGAACLVVKCGIQCLIG